ncbi:MAG: GNAT family N-acetyltransferase [Treponema sp.]|jgi:ribosomal protein S18 acetylase RimI-like enzyme|nr:GNAT family N-acetyltransferase [Treponema sp.]
MIEPLLRHEPIFRPCWRKIKKSQEAGAEEMLRANERWCMNACSRFIKGSPVWVLGRGIPSALVIHSRRTLLPVLCDQQTVPPPRFLRGIFGAVSLHSLQGRREDILVMENALEKMRLHAVEKIDYDIMCIDHPPLPCRSAAPVNLIIRKPAPQDMDALAALHAAYEQEEVLPAASEFRPSVSRLNIERIFAQERMLVAELGGCLIGKINTNAAAFTRCQIGGVYVHPDYRGMGIAGRMTFEFTESLTAQGRGISLFVKKTNTAARRVYQRIGFEITGDYRIDYY